jgi:radical SAM superfamily enzyme YgiQ (UPF0313 family)
MYNIILFSDLPFAHFFTRNYGMHRLATELRNNGYTVLCINYISSLSYDNYVKLIDLAVGPDTIMVGFSTSWMPYMIKGAKNNGRAVVGHKLNFSEYNEQDHLWYFEGMAHKFTQESVIPWIEYIKQKNPKIKITAGGVKAAGYIDIPEIDNVFIGSGETMVLDYVNSLSAKGPKRIFNKVIDYDSNAQNSNWEFRESLTEYIEDDLVQSSEFLNIEFSRGCMFQCAFCSYPLIGQTSARDIIKYKEIIYKELMNNWQKWGITKYLIVDSTLNDSTEKLELIKEVINSLPFRPKFWAYARIDLFAAHPEQAQLMLDIGVTEVLFGLESLNESTGKAINKGHKKNTLKGLKIAKEIWGDKIFLCASAVLGLPKETISSFEETVNWFVTEGNQYLDRLGYSPLTFASSIFDPRYVETSVIDRDMKKFGYTATSDSENVLDWVKDDGTDIISRDQVIDLISKWHPKFDNAGKLDKQLFWLSGYECIEPSYNYESLKMRDELNYFENLEKEFGTPQELYYKFATTVYWPKMFNFLENKLCNR